MRWAILAAGLAAATPAGAKTAVSCAGAAVLGAAQLLCSHVDPAAPTQFCTYSWSLDTAANQPQIVQGSFMMPPGASNVQIYQSAGFSHALTPPIVVCQGRKGKM